VRADLVPLAKFKKGPAAYKGQKVAIELRVMGPLAPGAPDFGSLDLRDFPGKDVCMQGVTLRLPPGLRPPETYYGETAICAFRRGEGSAAAGNEVFALDLPGKFRLVADTPPEMELVPAFVKDAVRIEDVLASFAANELAFNERDLKKVVTVHGEVIRVQVGERGPILFIEEPHTPGMLRA
jgi:hypothetical protein